MTSERTPEQIIGHDAYMQLVFEGYAVTRAVPDVSELVRYSIEWCHSTADEVRADTSGKYVLHSQAAAIIAAKDAEITSLKYIYGSATRNLKKIKGKLKAAEADNAALTARVKRLEHKERFWLDKNDALEAKLAAAVKALEPFANVAEHDIGGDEDDSDIFWPMSNARYSMAGRLRVGDLRRASAALNEVRS